MPLHVPGVPPGENLVFAPTASGLYVPVERQRFSSQAADFVREIAERYPWTRGKYAMPTDLPDWQQSVAIDTSGGPVNISGTVTASITSGTVTIANASIAVINASGTKITSARPPKFLGFVDTHPGGSNSGTFTLDSDCQALVFVFASGLGSFTHFKATNNETFASTANTILELYDFAQHVYAVPVLATWADSLGSTSSVITVALGGINDGFDHVVNVYEIFESSPLWLQIFPQPQLEPNQPPLAVTQPALANNTAAWLIASAANIQISLFDIITTFVSVAGAALYYVGHNAVLPVALPPASEQLFVSGNTGAFAYDFRGAQLPRGDGIYVWNASGGALGLWHTLGYSLG